MYLSTARNSLCRELCCRSSALSPELRGKLAPFFSGDMEVLLCATCSCVPCLERWFDLRCRVSLGGVLLLLCTAVYVGGRQVCYQRVYVIVQSIDNREDVVIPKAGE